MSLGCQHGISVWQHCQWIDAWFVALDPQKHKMRTVDCMKFPFILNKHVSHVQTACETLPITGNFLPRFSVLHLTRMNHDIHFRKHLFTSKLSFSNILSPMQQCHQCSPSPCLYQNILRAHSHSTLLCELFNFWRISIATFTANVEFKDTFSRQVFMC